MKVAEQTSPADMFASENVDEIASTYYGVYDSITDWGHGAASIVVAPLKEDGSTDWGDASPLNLEKPSSDSGPADMAEARRWAILVDDIEACDTTTSMLLWLDPETGNPTMEQIAGPTADGDIAMRIIGRDIGAVPPPREYKPGPLAQRFMALAAEFSPPPVAANDNNPPSDELARLSKLQRQHGGEIRGTTLFGACIDGKHGQIYIGKDGKAAFVTANGSWDVDETKPRLKIKKPSEWEGVQVPVREWYIPDLLPARNVTTLTGDGGLGKTLVALQIGVAGALGVTTLGVKPKHGRVFYVGAEDEDGEFQRRMLDILKSHHCSFEDLGDNFCLSAMAGEDATLALPDKAKVMKPTPLMGELIDQVGEFNPDLLVLDTSADLFGGDEINRVQVRQFIGMLRKVAISFDCAILMLSHPSLQGMQSGSGLSGSTAWNNSVRSRLFLTGDPEDDDARILTTVKANYGKKGGEIRMRWEDGVFVSDDGRPTPALTILTSRHDDTFRTLLSAINRTGQRVATTKGINYAPTVLADRQDAGGITKKQFEAAMHRLLDKGVVKVVWEGPPSKQRQRLVVSAEDFGPSREAA